MDAQAQTMERFYHKLRENDFERPAECLREAQLQMAGSQDGWKPVYWAGFMIFGTGHEASPGS